ncbi:polyprenol monophosphomannose synthase [Aquipuribacter sp. SD81]|uniref:polyprenol monophosphomannose synthase n=1 Tax=Aquipuribacter sp. SD81 TaxID=3127703 RepID=UPI0030184234
MSSEEPVPPRTVVCIPTYDEIDSLPGLLDRLRAAQPDVDVLVVDDDSPDGTGRYADERAAADPRVHVLHRTSKDGLGAAYLAAFRWALARDYDVVCEMDADGSHAPEQLHRLLAAVAAGADLVIGSRWVNGGEVTDWPVQRRLLSRGGNLYTRLALGTHLRDATAGYRAFTAHALRTIPLDDVASAGYCFQVDLAWRAVRAGLTVVEVPITFAERAEGVSKMSGDIVREALWRVTVWGAEHRAGQLRRLGARARTHDGRDGS